MSRPVDAPTISLSTANGAPMPNRGAREITTLRQDGTPITRRFYDADVEMPILSVAELSREGECGSDVRFRRRDGYIEDLASGHKEYFVKRKGVYFTKLYIPKSELNSTGFPRPVA